MAITLKKGDKVILHMFTGCPTAVKEIIAADKTTVTIETTKGEMTFNRKTGKQVEPEPSAERYANFITEDDGSFVPPQEKAKKAPKKPKAKAPKASEETEEEEAEEEEAPKKAKKSSKKPVRKKPEPEPVDEDDEEEDEFDEFEDVEE